MAIEMAYQLPADADSANLRVLLAGGVSTPAQFESGNDTKGKLVFVLPAGVPAGNTQAQLLAMPKNRGWERFARMLLLALHLGVSFNELQHGLNITELAGVRKVIPDFEGQQIHMDSTDGNEDWQCMRSKWGPQACGHRHAVAAAR